MNLAVCPYRKLDPARKNEVSSRREANHSVCRSPIASLAGETTCQLLCNPYILLSLFPTPIFSNAYIKGGQAFGLRRPVVRSGGVVHRPGTRPRLIPFPVAEWIWARANPSPTRDEFSIGDSSRNTNRGFDAASSHGTRSHDRGIHAEWNHFVAIPVPESRMYFLRQQPTAEQIQTQMPSRDSIESLMGCDFRCGIQFFAEDRSSSLQRQETSLWMQSAEIS